MGGWIVTGLTENSAVEKLGLRIDDIIISVNEIPVEEISYEIQNHYFDNLDQVSLVIKSPEGLKNIEFELAPLL